MNIKHKTFFTPVTKFIIAIILAINVFSWNLIPANAATAIEKSIKVRIVEKSNAINEAKIVDVEKGIEATPQGWPLFLALFVIAVVVAGVICYVIIKAADCIPRPTPTNAPEDTTFSGPLLGSNDTTPIMQWPTRPGYGKCNITIEKSYNQGGNWNTVANIYDYPNSWEVKDYKITNNIVPMYRALRQ